MGKTFLSYFRKFHPSEIAQFYIYSEVPTDDSVCENYYRFTDWDALKSLFSKKTEGIAFSRQDIDRNRIDSRTDSSLQSAVYRAGSRKTPLLHMMRWFIWKHSNWNSSGLNHWIRSFQPDAVLFASGDTIFMYEIAKKISEAYDIPLIVSAVDDYYLFNRNKGKPFANLFFRLFMSKVVETMQRAVCLLSICDSMGEEYQQLFGIPTRVLRTPVENRNTKLNGDARQISYIGNLDLKRYQQLEDIGRVLKGLDEEGLPNRLDVYSQESDPVIIQQMADKNGIRFHGAISQEEVVSVMENSRIVVHTESFDPAISESVKYSVSTKIPESLMNGPCLFAYGPEGIESIDYLKKNEAAYTVTSKENLQEGLKMILTNSALRNTILANARELAHKNHDAETIGKIVRKWIEECIVCQRN